jgi:DNA-directed RNA polymerase subunit K/omega
VPNSDVRTSTPESRLNKYEMVVVAAREARRINEQARQQGREIKGRVTDVAMKRYIDGDVKYRYEEAAAAPTPTPSPMTTDDE